MLKQRSFNVDSTSLLLAENLFHNATVLSALLVAKGLYLASCRRLLFFLLYGCFLCVSAFFSRAVRPTDCSPACMSSVAVSVFEKLGLSSFLVPL